MRRQAPGHLLPELRAPAFVACRWNRLPRSVMNSFLLFMVEDWQQRLSQARQIPGRDLGLVAICVPAVLIDRTENLSRIVLIHKGTWSVVDCLSSYGHVVRIHHPVDEADEQPSSDEVRL